MSHGKHLSTRRRRPAKPKPRLCSPSTATEGVRKKRPRIQRRFPQGGNRLKFSLITDGGDRLSVVEFHPIVFQPRNGRAVFIEGRFAENRVVAAAVKGD